MGTNGQELLPPFEAFVAAVKATRFGVPFSKKLLRDVYRLGKGRLRYARLAKEEEGRSSGLRKKAARLRKLVRRREELAASASALQAELQREGLNSERFHDSTSRIDIALRDLKDVMESAEQDVIDSIFPSRTHGLKQRWEGFRLGYDLPHLGFKAADTWFLLGADKIFAKYCKMRELHITKTQHWEILKTFVHALFKEAVEAKAIERLIRSRCKNSE